MLVQITKTLPDSTDKLVQQQQSRERAGLPCGLKLSTGLTSVPQLSSSYFGALYVDVNMFCPHHHLLATAFFPEQPSPVSRDVFHEPLSRGDEMRIASAALCTRCQARPIN